MELYKGRPENADGRQEREIRVYDCLDKLGIEYERTDHEHADTMEACNEIDEVLNVLIMQELIFMQPAEDRLLSVDDAGRQAI